MGDNAQKYPENRVFWILQKKKSPLMSRIFEFKSCTIMTFMILLKPHVWGKSSSQVKCKNAVCQSHCRIFKLQYLKNCWRYKVDFLHAGTYLLKLHIDYVILGGHGQASPDMPKEAIKTLRSQKLK